MSNKRPVLAEQMPALAGGPVTTSAGGVVTAIANGAISNAMLANAAVANLSGTNTGDQTNITGNAATVTTNANLTGPVTSTGNATAIANGAISNAMLANADVANLSGTNTGDNATNSQYSGLVSNATHTGDATGATALTVVAINGTSLAALATGILKNTTTTGVPSIAIAADFPTLNQNTTGTAALATTVTTNANLTGPVTSTGNATAIANGAISNAMLANAAVANLSGTNTGDNATNTQYTANPMTAVGDLVLGSTAGAPSRLPIGTNAYVLTSNGTTAAWAAASAGFSDPMTTRGDIIIRNAANATARLGIGTSGQVLSSDGTDISWATPSGFTYFSTNTSVYGGTYTAPGASGIDNTILGVGAGTNMTIGKYSTFVGAGAAGTNAMSADGNTAVGAWAGKHITTGANNTILGYNAASGAIVTGANNVIIGKHAGINLAGAANNVIIGSGAATAITGAGNIAIGYGVAANITSATDSVIMGYNAVGTGVMTGISNVVIGSGAAVNITSAASSVIIGTSAVGTGVMTGADNTIIGKNAGKNITSAANSVIIGSGAVGSGVMTGSTNTIIGQDAGTTVTSADGAIIIGASACNTTAMTGTSNTVIGTYAGQNVTSASNLVAIGYSVVGGTGPVTGADNVFIGRRAGFAATSLNTSIFIGRNAGSITTTGSNRIILGPLNYTAHDNTIAFGVGDVSYISTSAANQITFGTTTSQLKDMYIGRGAVGDATATAITIRPSPVVGTDIAGANFTLLAGNGTGTGGSGKILFQTAPVAGTSSTANTLATRLEIDNAGGVGYYGSTSGIVSVKTQAAAGTYNFNLPTTAGTAGQVLTSQGGGSTAMTWTAASSPTISSILMPLISTSGFIHDTLAAGTYIFAGAAGIPILSGANSSAGPVIIYINAANYPNVAGVAAKMKITGILNCNDTAPTGAYTLGLYPLTRPATSGGADVNIWDAGTVVTGSNGATWNAPAADTQDYQASSTFTIPSTGYYGICVLTTAQPTTDSRVWLQATLSVETGVVTSA